MLAGGMKTTNGSESALDAFSWDKEMGQDASVPATDSLLFPHVHFARRPLAEKLLNVGRAIAMRQEDGCLVRGKVEVVCGENIFWSAGHRVDWIHLDQVVSDSEWMAYNENTNGSPSSSSDSSEATTGDTHSQVTAEHLSEAGMAPVDMIKTGQWMELQDAHNPCEVHLVQVVCNRGGLLTVREGSLIESVMFTDDRCHEVGWAQSESRQYHYQCVTADHLEAARCNAVSSNVFSCSAVKEHKFEAGMMLEVLDTANGGVFYAGYVSRVIDRYYFNVRVSHSIKGPYLEITAHRAYPYIFPVYWCARHNLRLTPPEDYVGGDFSWNAYREQCGLTKGSVPEHCFDLPRVQRPFDKLRNVEVLDVRSHDVMYPGKVVRSMRHLVWVHLCHYANATPPAVFSISSGLMFPCGFAAENGIRMQQATNYMSMGEPTSDDRFNLRTLCTSRATPVFTAHDKRFLSPVWLTSDLWLPTVYVRKTCFAGPFINPDRFRQMPNSYRPGPMPSIMRSILSDLIGCAYKPKQMCELLMCPKDSTLPQMVIKARIKFKKHRTRVECCERVSELAGWMRGICILIDACPDLCGITNSGCESYCHTLREVGSMSSVCHAWTVNTHATSHKVLPRRMRRLVPGSHANLAHVVRKRKPIIQIYEPRRPLTRAVTHNECRARRDAERRKNDRPCSSRDLPLADTQSALPESTLDKRTCVSGQDEGLMVLPSVDSNPLVWTASELARWIADTDSWAVASVLQKEEIDGEAFVLLSLNHCMNNLGLKLGPALKLNALIKELNRVCKERFGT